MVIRVLGGVLALGLLARAQTVCPATPQYSPCDLAFDVPTAKADQNLNLHVEFRSPRHRTALVNAFWDGGSRWVVRFTPTEAGTYDYRVTSSVPAYEGKQGQFTATATNKPGWVRAANVHHFANVDENVLTPHLWMGATVNGFAAMPSAQWNALVDARSSQKFNHLAVTLVDEAAAGQFRSPEFFRAAEDKIRYANQHGIVVDLAFAGPNGLLNRLLKSRDERKLWFERAISRLGAFDLSWQGLEAWESYDNGRELLKEIGEYIGQFDPYKHTRSSRAQITSAPLTDDGWLRYRTYATGDDEIGTVDQQVLLYPAVNDFSKNLKDTDGFRRGLWNATANGQYPSPTIPNDQAAAQMKIWYDFMSATRHWELEPFFEVDGGRGVALEGVEYVLYIEKPGPVSVNLEKQKYDVEWFNPANGERVAYKPERMETFSGEPPDKSHDWVLHIWREGREAGMLKSYKFESREILRQEVESNPEKTPFDIEQPAADTFSLGSPAQFRIKLKKETKATRKMIYEWTGEVAADLQSYRVIGSGSEGTFQIPANIALRYPAGLHIRVTAVNGLGKVYEVNRNYTLTK